MHAPRPVTVDDDLRRWRDQFPEATPIENLRARHRGTVVGVVTRIRYVPPSSFTLHVSDGTGEVEATWTGRQELPGVMLGSALQLSATVSRADGGRPKLLNPAWSPVTEPFTFPP